MLYREQPERTAVIGNGQCCTYGDLHYGINGLSHKLREWVEKDCPVSSEKMAEMMYSLSRKVIV